MKDEGIGERLVGRLLETGWSRERVIADIVIDGEAGDGSWGVLDRINAADRFGLVERPSQEAVRRWVRAELLHAITYGTRGQQLHRMSEAEIRAEFEAALAELRE